MLLAFEAAEREEDPAARRRLLTFVVIGGGATGVEMAGAFAELARYILARDFRSLDPSLSRVLLVEIGAAHPPGLPREPLGERRGAAHVARGRGHQGPPLPQHRRAGRRVRGRRAPPAATVIWAAGVRGTPLARSLGVELDRIGRVKVEPDCSLPGHPNAFAIGDMAMLRDRNGVDVPGLSPAAIQEGRFVARCILGDLEGRPRGQFAYRDKGTMATIGRSRAIAKVGRLQMSGTLAWLAWLGVHVLFLIGFKNRFAVMFAWMWQYITFKRGARLITGHTVAPRSPRRRPRSRPRRLARRPGARWRALSPAAPDAPSRRSLRLTRALHHGGYASSEGTQSPVIRATGGRRAAAAPGERAGR